MHRKMRGGCGVAVAKHRLAESRKLRNSVAIVQMIETKVMNEEGILSRRTFSYIYIE